MIPNSFGRQLIGQDRLAFQETYKSPQAINNSGTIYGSNGGNFVATKGSNSENDSFKIKIIINGWRVLTKQRIWHA